MTENQILDSDFSTKKTKPVNLVILVLLLTGIGGMIGATTNLINGNVSEEYFRRILGWNFEGIWKAAILQGIFEGLIYGLIFSLIYTTGFAIITKKKGDWKFIKKLLKKLIPIIYGCWLSGGIIALLLSLVFPDEYGHLIRAVPKETIPKIKYAWVGGSIWGGIIGGIISLIYGLIITHKEWRKSK